MRWQRVFLLGIPVVFRLKIKQDRCLGFGYFVQIGQMTLSKKRHPNWAVYQLAVAV